MRSGTRRDAVLHSVSANAAHGLRRTNEDKRRAVLTLLQDDEWGKWSNSEIARRCGVSDRFVGNIRAELSPNGSKIPATRTVERNGRVYDAEHRQHRAPADRLRAHQPQPAARARDRALSECSRIDECQSWADKAEALASYAKQAKDESLRRMAERIQARAIRRCGQLMERIPPQQGANQNIRDGAVPKVGRTQAARDAGLSERQRKTALRVANVPEEDFNAQVESDSPPTVTQLAEQGKKARPLVDLQGIDPKDYARATELQGTLRRFAEYCEKNAPQLSRVRNRPTLRWLRRRHQAA